MTVCEPFSKFFAWNMLTDPDTKYVEWFIENNLIYLLFKVLRYEHAHLMKKLIFSTSVFLIKQAEEYNICIALEDAFNREVVAVQHAADEE